MALPLLALRRLRSDSGAVVLPGNPIPGSGDWAEDIKKRRIKQGFAQAQKAPTAKTKKPATKAKAKAKSAGPKEE